MNCEHTWKDERNIRFCTTCNKTRITIQYFQNGKAMGETVAMVPAETEQAAVDHFMQYARVDLRYRFLGKSALLKPNFPNDYLFQEIYQDI